MIAEQPSAAGRRDPERARKGLAEYRFRLVARRDVDEIARQQLVLVKRRCVGFEAALVFETAFDEIERDLRQPPLGHPVQVFDVDGLIDVHCRPIPRAAAKQRNFAYFRIVRQSPAERGRPVPGVGSAALARLLEIQFASFADRVPFCLPMPARTNFDYGRRVRHPTGMTRDPVRHF
jgi:hypothetical protein